MRNFNSYATQAGAFRLSTLFFKTLLKQLYLPQQQKFGYHGGDGIVKRKDPYCSIEVNYFKKCERY